MTSSGNTSRRARTLAAASALAVLLFCRLAGEAQAPAQIPASASGLKDAKAERFVLPHYEDGVKVWELRGLTASFVGDDIEITEPRLVYFKAGDTDLKSKVAIYRLTGKICEMRLDVELRRQSDFLLTSQSVDFMSVNRLFVFAGPFRVIQGGMELRASEGRYDIQKNRLDCLGKTVLYYEVEQ